jgi:hypothetical protein
VRTCHDIAEIAFVGQHQHQRLVIVTHDAVQLAPCCIKLLGNGSSG